MRRAFLIRGGGGHGAVVYEALRATLDEVEVIVWDDAQQVHPLLGGLTRVRTQKDAQQMAAQYATLDVMVAIGNPILRAQLVDEVKSAFVSGPNLAFPNVIHKTAFVSPSAVLGEGVFVGPQAVINTQARVGSFCIINTGAVVEHDCILESFATLNPHAVLGGGVLLRKYVVLGLNASVRDHVVLTSGVVVGMGGVVVRNHESENATLLGVPCRPRNTIPSTNDAPGRVRWCLRKEFSLERFGSYLAPSIAKSHLTNDGPLQSVAARKVQDLLHTKRLVLLAANGTAALHALAAGLEIKLGKRLRWATQAFTFPSSIQGPFCSAIVVDVEEDTLYPKVDALERIQDLIDGVVVTNVFGLQGSILEMEQWCKVHEKLLIFDNAATAVGLTVDGRCIHDVGDGAIVSLHETKPIGRGEGGAIFVSQELLPYVHQAINFGFDVQANVRVPHRFASNWRMSDVAAAALCDHWDRITEQGWVDCQSSLLQRVDALLPVFGFGWLPKPSYPTLASCLFIRLNVMLTDDQLDNIVARLLRSAPSVEAKRYYRPLSSEATTAWKVFRSTVCIPFHVGLTEDLIVHSLKSLRVAVDAVIN